MSESKLKEVSELFEKAFNAQSIIGFDALQLTAQFSSKKGIGIFEKKIDSVELAEEVKIGVWLKKESRWAALSIEKVSWETLEIGLKNALQLTGYSDPDDHYQLAAANQYEVAPLSSKVSMKKLEQMALELEAQAFAQSSKIKNVSEASVGERLFSNLVMNSEGLKVLQSNQYSFASLSVIALGDDARPNNIYEATYATQIDDLPIQSFASKCAKECLNSLNPQIPSSGTYPVVFDAQMSAQLLSSFTAIFSGDLLYKHLTQLEGRLGESIASPLVNILDSAKEGFISHLYDGEGSLSNASYLIEKGVFKSFLHNQYTASKTASLNTANASYSVGSPSGVSPMNIRWEGSVSPVNDFIKSIDKGIYITQLHGASASAITGDFSYGAKGYLIDQGEIKTALADFTVAGNFFHLLKDVKAIGDDLSYFSPHLLGSVGGRSLLIGQMAIAGK